MTGLVGVNGQPAAPPYTNGPYELDQDITFNGNFRKSPGRFYLEEFFKQPPLLNGSIAVNASLDFEVVGTNAADAGTTYSGTVGGINIVTAGTDNDQQIVTPHLDTKQTAWAGVKWGTENQVIFESAIKTPAAITTMLIWSGLKLTNDPTVATDDDQVFIRYSTDDSDTNWELVYSIAGTDTTIDSGVAVAVSTTYKFRIEMDSDRVAHFYIDDVEVGQSTALTNDKDFIPYVGVMQLAGSITRAIDVHYIKSSRILFE